MWQRFLAWLDNTPLTNPIQRSQARLFQSVMLVLLIAEIPSFFLVGSIDLPDQIRLFFQGATVLGVLCYSAALVFIRRGHFSAGIYTGLGGLVVLVTVNAIPGGVIRSPIIPLTYMLPIILAGGIVGWRGLMLVAGSSIVLMIGIARLETLPTPLSGYTLPQNPDPIPILITVTMIIGVSCILLGLVGWTLRRAMEDAVARQRELELLRDSLEQTVAERTASLETALREGERREATLSATLVELQDTRATVRELSASVIPVLPGVLVAPLVGAMYAQRITDFAEHLLREVERQRATHVVLDITGMPIVDTQVAQTLLHAATSVRLLGGTTMLVGVRPEVAQTMVMLGTDLTRLPTYPDLREAVATLIDRAEMRR